MSSNTVTSTYPAQASGGGLSSPSGPRPLQLVDGNVQPINTSTTSSASSSCASPAQSTHGLPSPPPSTRKTLTSRRQSSISYYPSDHTPYWEPRSPARTAITTTRRSASVIIDDVVPVVNGKKNRRSTGSLDVLTAERERSPLTLTEK